MAVYLCPDRNRLFDIEYIEWCLNRRTKDQVVFYSPGNRIIAGLTVTADIPSTHFCGQGTMTLATYFDFKYPTLRLESKQCVVRDMDGCGYPVEYLTIINIPPLDRIQRDINSYGWRTIASPLPPPPRQPTPEMKKALRMAHKPTNACLFNW